MRKDRKDIWFPPMRYGIGWGLPVAWQGWAVLAVYFALVAAGVLLLNRFPWLSIPFVIYVFLLTGILLFICWKKGAPPELRWGDKDLGQ